MSESLRTVLLQEVRAKFSAIDWNLGSVVRELVIEPLAKLGDILDGHVNRAKASLNVANICDNPELHEEELDAWLTRLSLTPTNTKNSTGTVKIFRTLSNDLIITDGTTFDWNDEITVSVLGSHTLTTDVLKANDPGGILYKSYDGLTFSAEVPVECVSVFERSSLGAGSPLNWSEAPDDVYDIRVGSAISGGYNNTHPAEKARMILDALTPDALSGEDCIRKALRANFPEYVADVVVGEKDPKTPHAVSLYIKPVQSLQEFYVPVKMTAGVGEVQGCGIYKVLELSDSFGAVYPITVNYPNNSGDTGSIIKVNTLTTLLTGDCSVRVLGFPEYATINNWLIGETKSTPFEFLLKIPAVSIIRMYLSATGSNLLGPRSEIAEMVSSKGIDGTVSDTDVEKILIGYDMTLSKSITYSMSIQDREKSFVHSAFRSVSPGALKYTTNVPVIMYSQTNLIEISGA